MRLRLSLLLAAAAVCFLAAWSRPDVEHRVALERSTDALSALAVSTDPLEAAAARQALRLRGPEALTEFLAFHEDVLERHRKAPGEADAEWARVRQAADAIAAQRDAHASGLYWETSLDAAIARAQRERRPILSLRLLGRLDEELSCANSRFFRTVLYADGDVAEVLRERFVLHWQSERPVPKLTIESGDGSVLRTTITGNSVHHVLASDGTPVDSLTGVYGPEEFLRRVENAGSMAGHLTTLRPDQGQAALAEYHSQQLDAQRTELAAAVKAAGIAGAPNFRPDLVFSTGSFVTFPEGTKNAVEIPVMSRLFPGTEPVRSTLPDDTWTRLAQVAADSRLSAGSRTLMLEKKLAGGMRGDVADELTLLPVVRALERSVSEDAIRNEHLHHREIHEWFVNGEQGDDLEALNGRIYRELFRSTGDEWLGLVPPNWNGLDADGLDG